MQRSTAVHTSAPAHAPERRAEGRAPQYQQIVECNAALVVSNLELHELLDRQQVSMDAMHSSAAASTLLAADSDHALEARQRVSREQLATLTDRQREVLALVLAGEPSKRIAAVLGISQRTVENHRASIMLRTGSASVPALAQLAMLAGFHVPDQDV